MPSAARTPCCSSLGDGEYEVRCLTEKGKALFDGKLNASERGASLPSAPEKRFDAEQGAGLRKRQFR